MAFIQLRRRFRELNPPVSAEQVALESYASLTTDTESGIGWSELLSWDLAVILGEPGSGKTYEFRHKADELRDGGEPAFYIRLDDLLDNTVESTITPEDAAALEAWKRGRDIATFFLDSVDEAKLRVSSDFGKALRRFRSTVDGRALARTRILISSRISEWEPTIDAEEVSRTFRRPATKTASKKTDLINESTSESDLHVVQIEPLDRARVASFATARGVKDTPKFLTALDEYHAWIFARRPLDVDGLVAFWQRHNRLGTLTELIEYDLERNLREVEGRSKIDPLTADQARTGAETLAAAAVLCRRLTFRVSDDTASIDSDVLDARECLPTAWTPAEVRAVLDRAVFDGESYGRIRFHHRQVLEYLAASWLTERLRDGCAIQNLRDVLLDTSLEPPELRPSLAPVTAWLANGSSEWNMHVRNWITNIAPDLHFRYGDPSALPAPYKQALLQALVARYRTRGRVWLDLDSEILARLADPALADDVSKIFQDRTLAVDLRADMLMLVRHGQLLGCLDSALDIIASDEESTVLKTYAVAALRDINSKEHLDCLWGIVTGLSSIESSLCGCICEALFPQVVDSLGLVDILQKVERVPEQAIDLQWVLKRHLEETLTADEAIKLLAELNRLILKQPYVRHNGKEIAVSARYLWLGDVMPVILLKALTLPSINALSQTVLVEALRTFANVSKVRHRHPREDMKAVPEATFAHPSVRREYFWRLVEDWHTKHGRDPSTLFQVYDFYSVLSPDERDRTWLIEDITDRESERDRVIALLAVRELTRAWSPSSYLAVLRNAFSSNATRRQYLSIVLRTIPQSLRRLWYRRLSHTVGSSWWWRRRFHAVRSVRIWLRDQWVLTTRLRKLASGTQHVWLCNLAREAAVASDRSHWAPSNWDAVKHRRGRLIAWAAERGCINAWRHYRPYLPHEKPNPNSTDARVIMGLAGLNAAVAKGRLNFASITNDEAKLAVRYSVNELNGFAPWMGKLANAKPQAVRHELAECITGEWAFHADRKSVHEVLADILWHGGDLAHLVVPSVLTNLRHGDPRNIAILEQVLSILLAHAPNEHRAVAHLARHRVVDYREDSRFFTLWLSVWLQLDSNRAVEFLVQYLAESRDPADLMVRLCSELRDEHHSKGPRIQSPSYLQPKPLRELIPLVYRYVDPAEDIHRAGSGTFTPGPRDHAQDFRDSLLRRLAGLPHASASAVLEEFAEVGALALQRDWILHLLDQRRRRLADGAPWLPVDVRTFAVEFECEPRSEADLFCIANRRLSDLKDYVETDDHSPRNELRDNDIEARLRSWLARNLDQRSRNQYTIPQEEEVPLGNPDLRFHRSGLGPVSVEVKWANRWTGPQLLERLEHQLVGQYMRAKKARFGIYVVGRIGNQRYWVLDGRRITFDVLISTLQKRAQKIIHDQPSVKGLRVVGIDFVHPA